MKIFNHHIIGFKYLGTSEVQQSGIGINGVGIMASYYLSRDSVCFLYIFVVKFLKNGKPGHLAKYFRKFCHFSVPFLQRIFCID